MINNPPTINPNSFLKTFSDCINNQITVISAGSGVLKANPKRAYAIFINVLNADLTLIIGEIKDGGINKVIVLKPGGSYEITQINLYIGKISAISNSESKISLIECSHSENSN